MRPYVVALGSALVLCLAAACAKTEDAPIRQADLVSPGSTLVASVRLDGAGGLTYRIGTATDTQFYMRPSPIGIALYGADFTDSLAVVAVDETDARSAYTLTTGKQTAVDKPYRGLSLKLRNAHAQEATLETRLYEDGFAYRYRFDDLDIDSLVVTQERAAFVLPQGLTAWRQDYDTVTTYSPGYEQYWDAVPAEQVGPSDRGYVLPLYATGADRHLLIHESGLVDQYYASHLRNEGPTYRLVPPLEQEANGLYDTVARLGDKRYTPWRIIVAGATPQTVLATTLVTDLAPPRADGDFGWVEPGRAAWSWWSDWDSPQDYRKQVRFVDFAAEQGWGYVLVDANWERMRGGDVTQLAAYAKTKGVGLLLWYNSGGPHNDVPEGPRDFMHLAEPRRREFARIAAMGVAGVKVDFFQSDKQGVVRQYSEILADAAEARLLVNFHGCTAPRGWQRTWPNLVTMEAVVGAESYQFKATFPTRTPAQHTVLPLTRNAVGPMDFTPVTFTDRKYPHATTQAHELALPILFESGIVHYADDVDQYRALPEEVQRYLATVPTVWDGVRYLGGEPGKWLALERTKGDQRYIAVVNGTAEEMTVPLELPASDSQQTPWVTFRDAPELEVVVVDEALPTEIVLRPYGGYVAFQSLAD